MTHLLLEDTKSPKRLSKWAASALLPALPLLWLHDEASGCAWRRPVKEGELRLMESLLFGGETIEALVSDRADLSTLLWRDASMSFG